MCERVGAVTTFEIAAAVALKGLIFELLHQRRERSLRRKHGSGSTSPEHPGDGSTATKRLTGTDHRIGAIEHKSA
jgi:hypothetical protein